MSRRRVAVKREAIPDPIYNSVLVTRFINKIMLKGNKTIAQRIFYQAIDDATQKLGGNDPMEVLDRIVENVRPLLEVKSLPFPLGGLSNLHELKKVCQCGRPYRWNSLTQPITRAPQ